MKRLQVSAAQTIHLARITSEDTSDMVKRYIDRSILTTRVHCRHLIAGINTREGSDVLTSLGIFDCVYITCRARAFICAVNARVVEQPCTLNPRISMQIMQIRGP